jgi:hypothetical protein
MTQQDKSVQDMIAQPTVNTPPTKPQAPHTPSASSDNSGNGFLALLATNDSTLTDIAQNTGATVSNVKQAANTNKSSKSNDPTATPYIAAQQQPQPNQPSAQANSSTTNGSTGVNAAAANADAANAASQDAAQASATPAAGTGGGTGNSTSFGADQLNARVASGAPIYASQPSAAMATVPAHLLDSGGDGHMPVASTPGTPSTSGDAKSQKTAATDATTGTTATTATGPTSALTPSAMAPVRAPRAPSNDQDGTTGGNSNNDASTAAADAASDVGNTDTASASLLAQPTTPQTATAQADAAIHTAAPYVPVGEQVALNIKSALSTDNNEIRIQLKPEALGTIDVKLNMTHDGRVSAVITADRSDTLNMLKQDSGTLQQALQDAGLHTDNNSLSFSLSGGNAQSFAQNSSQGGSSGSGRFYPNSADNDAAGGNAAATPTQRSHAGALNIEV